MANVFHVEFGFNDTELTQSLEKENGQLAEKLIVENSQTSFLDEGAYQRIPLYICLCGRDEGWLETSRPRNLYLARLLVEHGANVNYRIPESSMSEYVGPGHSALELAVNFYNQVTCGVDVPEPERWNQVSDPVIGLNKKIITDYEELVEQLCELVFIMMGHGGDCNILDECRMTLLHRAVVYSSDLRLVKLLCENGADLNAQDYHGNSPLLALCEGPAIDEDIHSAVNTSQRRLVHSKQYFIKYLLSLKDVQIDVQNRWGCTALFYCMLMGDVASASLLLQAGADVTLQGKPCDLHTRPLSPLLASLVSPKMLLESSTDTCELWSGPANVQHILHFVDSGYFNVPGVVAEVLLYCQGQQILHQLPASHHVNSVITDWPHLGELGHRLLPLMFGGVSSSLKQLCVRQIIMQYCFSGDRASRTDKMEGVSFCRFSIDLIDQRELLSLLKILNVPKDLLNNFQIAIFMQRLACQLNYVGKVWYVSSQQHGSDSDTYPSDQNDSDLEYW